MDLEAHKKVLYGPFFWEDVIYKYSFPVPAEP